MMNLLETLPKQTKKGLVHPAPSEEALLQLTIAVSDGLGGVIRVLNMLAPFEELLKGCEVEPHDSNGRVSMTLLLRPSERTSIITAKIAASTFCQTLETVRLA